MEFQLSRHHEPHWTNESMVKAGFEAVAPFSKEEQELLMGGSAMRLWPELAK